MTNKDPNDKRAEYKVDFHTLVDHTDEEVKPEDGKVNDWHERHKDRLLDTYCDTHPGSPECKVFDE